MNTAKEKSFICEMSNFSFSSPTPSSYGDGDLDIFARSILKSTTTSVYFPGSPEEESYMYLPTTAYSKGISKNKQHQSYERLLSKYKKVKNELILITGKYNNLHMGPQEPPRLVINQYNREDFPDMLFWTAHDWKVSTDAKKNLPDVIEKSAGPRGPGRCAKGVNIATRWHRYHVIGKAVKAEATSVEIGSSEDSLGKWKASKATWPDDAAIKKARPGPETGDLSESFDTQANAFATCSSLGESNQCDSTSGNTTENITSKSIVNNAPENTKANHSTSFVPPAPSVTSVHKPVSEIGLSEIVSAALALTSAVEVTNGGKEGGKKKAPNKDYLRVTTAITPRNLCAKDWLQDHPSGLKADFDIFYKDLSKDLQRKYASDAAVMKLDAKG
ncbi:hypothetical protein SERLADRAFT_416185 [Serpula lacrymans var. lacrymans S7.9]|uniref:Uncharacterized protein n=1 Tax=Serpula lacrymans var. lacrymans (strain S7.9) TaxID=578457 RepID=F8NZ70_SERL9|nr:uncharacterized protein SERLADRAFT_416185 [Serpula lacrymans var. lacrymans S7.9]EGO23890.1 hypothetical protein SERLADRAFT_416185 [Serpula lacrymans var. lacrymans S7.9]